MIVLEFNGAKGSRIGIPADKITGFCTSYSHPEFPVFIATGAESADGDNGWFVTDDFQKVKDMLEACLNP